MDPVNKAITRCTLYHFPTIPTQSQFVRVIPETPRAHRPCRVVVSVRNPLSVDLTDPVFALEAPGLAPAARRRPRRAKVAPGETAEVEMEARPWRAGATAVVATFNSRHDTV